MTKDRTHTFSWTTKGITKELVVQDAVTLVALLMVFGIFVTAFIVGIVGLVQGNATVALISVVAASLSALVVVISSKRVPVNA